jgi:hypothetical protein
MKRALTAPHDLARYYRPKRGKYRRRTVVPAAKAKKGHRLCLGTSSNVGA